MRCFSKIHRGIATSFTQNNTFPKTITVTIFLRYCEISAKKCFIYNVAKSMNDLNRQEKGYSEQKHNFEHSKSNAKIFRDWSESKTFNVLSLLLSYLITI